MCEWRDQEDNVEQLYAGIEAERLLVTSTDIGERAKELAWQRIDGFLDILSDLRVMEKTVDIVSVPK